MRFKNISNQILILLIFIEFSAIGQADSSFNCQIDLLDSNLTFYIVSVPNPGCTKGVECHSIYKISISGNDIFGASIDKINGYTENNTKMDNLGYFKQDFSKDEILWNRQNGENDSLISTSIQLPEWIKKQYLEKSDSKNTYLISEIIGYDRLLDKNDIDILYNFVVRIFSYDTEPKEFPGLDGKPGVVMHSVGGSSYFLLAIGYREKYLYKSDKFNHYKKRLNDWRNN